MKHIKGTWKEVHSCTSQVEGTRRVHDGISKPLKISEIIYQNYNELLKLKKN